MVGLEDVQSPRAAAIGYRVDEDQRVPVVKQVVGQVHAPDAVVDGPDARIVLLDWDVPDHLGAEPVVAEEDVADACHQNAHWTLGPSGGVTYAGSGGNAGHPVWISALSRLRPLRTTPAGRETPILRFPCLIPFSCGGFERLDFVGGEVQVAAVPLVQVGRRIVLDDDADVLVAVNVFVHCGDASRLSCEEQVLCVGSTPRMQKYSTASRDPDTIHQHRIQVGLYGVVGQWIPPIHAVGYLRNQAYGLVRIPQRSGQARHGFGRHRVTAVDDLRGQRIGGPGLRLLLVGHRHHTQREDLVDLGAVIQRGLALFSDLGVVVENDRGDQQQIPGAGRAGQHRETAVLTASGHRVGGLWRRLEERDEFAANDFRDDVGADQGTGYRVVFLRSRATGVCDPYRDPMQPTVRLDADGQRGAHLATGPDQLTALDRFDVGGRGGGQRQ